MYKGEFKDGRKYEAHAGKEITYVGRVNNTHYVVNSYNKDKAFAVSDDSLRDCVISEILPTKKITGYVNIYDGVRGVNIYKTREEADLYAEYDRTECVKVTITYTEKQFDD